jgi:uncharacterized protein DUF87
MEQLALQLRRLVRGSETEAGRRWHAKAEQNRSAHALARRQEFLSETRCNREAGRLIVGRARDPSGTHQWCGLRIEQLTGQHVGVSGATGMGKSFMLAAILWQLIKARVPVIVVDMKSELCELLLDTIVPALVSAGREDLVDQVRVIRPFDPLRVPLLRLTEPERDVSTQVQSLNIATALGEAVGQDHGLRMQRLLLPAAGFAVERNLPLPTVLDWLRDPVRFAREAAASTDPVIRAYAIHELPRENRSSLDAVRARLDLLFHLPEVRQALSAPRCIDFHECLRDGLTLLDFGSPPGGAEGAMRFVAGPVTGRLSRAILSREVSAQTPHAVVLFEEFQELLGRHQIEQFKRLLSLCRFKRVALHFSNQQPAQIAAADRTLLKVLRTNLGAEMIFRSSIEDARALSEGLAIRSPDETLTQARTRFIEQIAELPRRSYFLWLKGAAFGPQRLTSPRLDVDALRRAASSLSPDMQQRIRAGVASADRSEVELALAGEQAAPRQPQIVPLEEERRVRTPRLG